MTVRIRINAAVMQYETGDIIEVERGPIVNGMLKNGYASLLEETPTPEPVVLAFPETMPVPPEWLGAASPVGSAVRAELSAEVVAVPPRSGKGSGAEVWRKFLRGQGIDAPAADKAGLLALWDQKQAGTLPGAEHGTD